MKDSEWLRQITQMRTNSPDYARATSAPQSRPYEIPNSRLFGPTAYGLRYVYFSRVVAFFARRVRRVTCVGHCGDYGIFAPLDLAEEALSGFAKVDNMLHV